MWISSQQVRSLEERALLGMEFRLSSCQVLCSYLISAPTCHFRSSSTLVRPLPSLRRVEQDLEARRNRRVLGVLLSFPARLPRNDTQDHAIRSRDFRWVGADPATIVQMAATCPDCATPAPSLQGDYWEPGRKATESLLDLIPFPEGSVWEATSFRRVKFDLIDSGAYTRSQDVPFPPTSHHPTVMEKMMDLDDLAKQFGTWSSVHNYDQKHKGTRSIVEALMGELKEDLPRHTPFKCVWPLGLMVMKKKQ